MVIMLSYASRHDHTEIVKVLLGYEIDINLQNKDGDSALIYTSRYDHTGVVKMLLEYGADHNIQNNMGQSFLDVREWTEDQIDEFDELIGRIQSEYTRWI